MYNTTGKTNIIRLVDDLYFISVLFLFSNYLNNLLKILLLISKRSIIIKHNQVKGSLTQFKVRKKIFLGDLISFMVVN